MGILLPAPGGERPEIMLNSLHCTELFGPKCHVPRLIIPDLCTHSVLKTECQMGVFISTEVALYASVLDVGTGGGRGSEVNISGL